MRLLKNLKTCIIYVEKWKIASNVNIWLTMTVRDAVIGMPVIHRIIDFLN
jgi:hypothetical protein